MKLVALGVILTLLLLVNPQKLSITLYPQVVNEDASAWLTCHVPRDADNRRLTYGLQNYRNSERDLEGEASMVTWDMLLQHIPCGAGDAYCAVIRTDGTEKRVEASLLVSGCGN